VHCPLNFHHVLEKKHLEQHYPRCLVRIKEITHQLSRHQDPVSRLLGWYHTHTRGEHCVRTQHTRSHVAHDRSEFAAAVVPSVLFGAPATVHR
jgi:hypothetical protein